MSRPSGGPDFHYGNVSIQAPGISELTVIPVHSNSGKDPKTMRTKSASKSGVINPRVILTVALFAIGGSLALLSWASTPPTSSIAVPGSAGQKIEVTWTGEIPPLANATSDCTNLADTPAVDQHLPTINVPAGIYNALNAKFEFNISWDGASGNDEILTVLNPDGTTLDSSDGGDPT